MGPTGASLLDHVEGECELILGLLDRIPGSQQDWRPDWPSVAGRPPFSCRKLAWHLADSFSGFCAAFLRLHPEKLSHFTELRQRLESTRARADVLEARGLLESCRDHLRQAFAITDDDDFVRTVPTFFEPEGKPFLSILLVNLTHVTHHKFQLFIYLKMLGVDVSTPDLFRIRT